MAQDSNVNKMSGHPGSQDQDTEYEIIVEPNGPLMEPNGPFVESDKTHQNQANLFEALDGTDDGEKDVDYGPEYETTETRTPPPQSHPPQLYEPTFDNMIYDDTSEQIQIQVDDGKNIKLHRVRKCKLFDHIFHAAVM